MLKKTFTTLLIIICSFLACVTTVFADDSTSIYVEGYTIGSTSDGGYGSVNGRVNYIYGHYQNSEIGFDQMALLCAEPGVALPPNGAVCTQSTIIEKSVACLMGDTLSDTGNYEAYARDQLLLWGFLKDGDNDGTCEDQTWSVPENIKDATLTMVVGGSNMTLENGYFLSQVMEMHYNIFTSYSASIANAPAGSKLVDESLNEVTFPTTVNRIRLMIPASSVNDRVNATVTVTASVAGTFTRRFPVVIIYDCGSAQDLAVKGYDQITDPTGKTETASASFEISLGSLKITKKDNVSGANLSGAVFDLYTTQNTLVGTYTTGSNGEILIQNLAPGTYSIVERSAPASYKILTSNVTVTVAAGQTSEKIIYNEPLGKIIVNKVDNTNSNIKLANAVFELYKCSNSNCTTTTKQETDAYGTALGVLKTNASGVITINNLSYGTYQLKEITAPDNYFIIQATSNVTVNTTANPNPVVVNNAPLANLKIIKIDKETNQRLPGVEFDLYKCESTTSCNKPTKVVTDVYGNKIGDIITNSAGEYQINNLFYGKYIVKETKYPTGYEVLGEDVIVTIDKAHLTNNLATVTVNNTPIEIEIIKKDFHTKNNLAGATITITNLGTGSIHNEFITTTDSIKIRLVPGEYLLTEVIAPAGYVVYEESIRISVDAKGVITLSESTSDKIEAGTKKVTIYDERTKVNISKQDITNGEEIPGAEIVIKTPDGNLAKDAVTNEEIKFVSKDEPTSYYLAPGEYILQETVAPEGQSSACLAKIEEYKNEGYDIKDADCTYKIVENELHFKMNDDGNVEILGDDNEYYFLESNRIVVYNGSIPIPVPDTGAFVSIVSIIVGISLIYVGYTFVKRKKQTN